MKNYREVPTANVIRDLAYFGWKPVRAYQVKPKLESNKGFQKHFVYFRNEKYFIGSKKNVELIPEILISNSYDGRASFRMTLSMYRSVSDSRVIVGDNERIMHREVDNMEGRLKVSETGILIDRIINEHLPTSISTVKKLKKIQLDRIQQRNLAQELCKDRWNYKFELPNPEVLIKPLREEDYDSSAWIVFCKLHEKVLKGGWVGAGDRRIKPLIDPNREFLVNTKMYNTLFRFITKQKIAL